MPSLNFLAAHVCVSGSIPLAGEKWCFQQNNALADAYLSGCRRAPPPSSAPRPRHKNKNSVCRAEYKRKRANSRTPAKTEPHTHSAHVTRFCCLWMDLGKWKTLSCCRWASWNSINFGNKSGLALDLLNDRGAFVWGYPIKYVGDTKFNLLLFLINYKHVICTDKISLS